MWDFLSSVGLEIAVEMNRGYAGFVETEGHFLHLEQPEAFNVARARTLFGRP